MKTLLLLESDERERESTAELLRLAGYRVVTADNGKTGLELAISSRPDLVLSNTDMPVLDGYGTLHTFRRSIRLADVPFVLLSARTSRADIRRAMDLGADDYLFTPYDGSELLQAVASRLARFEHLHTDAESLGPATSILPAAPANLLTLVAGRRPHAVPRRQIIYAEGDEPLRMYYVQAGRVKTTKTTTTGKELITGFHQSGDFFGFKALLEGTSHFEAAVAIEDSTLLYVPADEFQLGLRSPEVSQQLVRLMASRKREREQQLLDMAYNSLRRRVANALLALHDHATPDRDNAVYIQLSRDDLAALVGVAPESLSRTVSEFRHDGLLEASPRGIRLVQPDFLRHADW